MKYSPHRYQEIALNHILDHKAAAMFLDMGLGKTVITLTALNILLYKKLESTCVLIIAPLRVAEDTWPREVKKWDHTKHLTVSCVLGTAKERIRALNKAADIYVINRENVVWLCEYCRDAWPFDTVVIDELSSFKSHQARRFRYLRKIRPQIQRIIGLTGTPAPNGLIDLWSQIYLLDQGERLGKTVTSYRQTYFSPGRSNNAHHVVYSWDLKEGSEAAIYARLSDLCISMSAEDWLEMPKRNDREVRVRIPAKAWEAYKQLEKDLLLPYADGGGDIVANTAATLGNKLLQLANGAVYDEHHGIREIHNAKIEALEEIVEAANGNPVLVFYAYRHDLARLQKAFPRARVLKEPKDITDWNQGKIQLLLMHPASAGHGLNLQDGGHIAVWFGLNWSLELYEQANARLYRQGQKHPVFIYHLIAEKTMDEDVLQALTGKAEMQDALMAAVKARVAALKPANVH